MRHLEHVEGPWHRGVETGRRTGHFADRPRPNYARSQGARLRIGAAQYDGSRGREPETRCNGGPKRAHHRGGRTDGRKEARLQVQAAQDVTVPVPVAQSEREGRRRVRPVGYGLAGEAHGDEVPRLQGEPDPSPRLRFVCPQPEQLRRDVEGGRQVAGPAVDLRLAERFANPARLLERAVVAIDEPSPDRTLRSVERDERRALAGQADGMDAAPRTQPSDELTQGRQRRRPPSGGVLLRPAGPGDVRRVRAPDLESTLALEVECRRSGAGCANVDRDERILPRAIARSRLGALQGRAVHPRTSWWAAILSRSSVTNAPLSAPVEKSLPGLMASVRPRRRMPVDSWICP